jgi:hypothetical protein
MTNKLLKDLLQHVLTFSGFAVKKFCGAGLVRAAWFPPEKPAVKRFF